MSDNRIARLDGLHHKMLRVESEGDRKKLADLRPVIGQLVERALELSGRTKQGAAFDMGYQDAGVISRWISGAERPLLDKLFALDGFQEGWAIAMAERNPAMELETVVKIRLRRMA